MAKLTDFRNPIDSWVAALEDKRDKLNELLVKLRLLYPSWRTRDSHDLDARPEYFMLLAVILQNVRLSFMFMHGQLCHREWWERHQAHFFGPQDNNQAYVEALQGYQTMARQYSISQVTSVTEYTLASVAMSGHGAFQLHSSSGFANAYDYVLSKLSLLEKYGNLFEILRLVRNTFHSNGIFSDPTGDTSKEYDGMVYDFRSGQLIGWGNDDMMLMFEWISDAMWEILNSSEVRSIPYVPLVHPGP